MFDLAGRRALVTGASGGLGDAIATALHASGAVVTITGTRAERLSALAERLGGNVHVAPADLADPVAIEALIKQAEEAMGGLDILVNNAGVTRDGLMVRMKDADWQAVLDVNLSAGFRLARAALRGMMRQRYGRIIGITSIVGVTGNAGQTNYAAAKAGMIGFAKALAQEVAGRGITVNCVAPGYIATAMTEDLPAEQKQRIAGLIPIGRLGEPGDVAAAVAYLASTEAGYVTGQTIHVNGGLAMP